MYCIIQYRVHCLRSCIQCNSSAVSERDVISGSLCGGYILLYACSCTTDVINCATHMQSQFLVHPWSIPSFNTLIFITRLKIKLKFITSSNIIPVYFYFNLTFVNNESIRYRLTLKYAYQLQLKMMCIKQIFYTSYFYYYKSNKYLFILSLYYEFFTKCLS